MGVQNDVHSADQVNVLNAIQSKHNTKKINVTHTQDESRNDVDMRDDAVMPEEWALVRKAQELEQPVHIRAKPGFLTNKCTVADRDKIERHERCHSLRNLTLIFLLLVLIHAQSI